MSGTSRGRTTTGMAAACLIATVTSRDVTGDPSPDESVPLANESYDGFDESAYLNGAPIRHCLLSRFTTADAI